MDKYVAFIEQIITDPKSGQKELDRAAQDVVSKMHLNNELINMLDDTPGLEERLLLEDNISPREGHIRDAERLRLLLDKLLADPRYFDLL